MTAQKIRDNSQDNSKWIPIKFKISEFTRFSATSMRFHGVWALIKFELPFNYWHQHVTYILRTGFPRVSWSFCSSTQSIIHATPPDRRKMPFAQNKLGAARRKMCYFFQIENEIKIPLCQTAMTTCFVGWGRNGYIPVRTPWVKEKWIDLGALIRARSALRATHRLDNVILHSAERPL